jgi:hypothetical protein
MALYYFTIVTVRRLLIPLEIRRPVIIPSDRSEGVTVTKCLRPVGKVSI